MPHPDQEPIRYLGDVRRMSLKPGDIVVISIDRPLMLDNAQRIRQMVEEIVPGHRCLVLGDSVRVDVVGEGAAACLEPSA